MKKLTKLVCMVSALLLSPVLKADYVNDFHCTLNEGLTVPQLFAFQQEWMVAAREKGFDENYRTEILFPIYNDNTTMNPPYFIWRGYFKDGQQWGEMTDWFLPSEWAQKFAQRMNCRSASLWNKP